MLTQSEVVALVSAAARPFRVEFSRSAEGITLNRKRSTVHVPLPPVVMDEGKAESYLLQVYDAVAAARWCGDRELERDKEGNLKDSLAYSLAMRRAQAKAMDTWAGDAALYERDFRGIANEFMSADMGGLDDAALKNIAAEVVALRQVSGESASIRNMIDSLPPQIKRLVDMVPDALPADPVDAANEVRRILDIPPPPPSGGGEGEGEGEGDGDATPGEGDGEGDADGEGEEGDGEGKPSKGKSTAVPKSPVEKSLKPREYDKDSSAIGADGVGEYTLTPEEEVVVIDCADPSRSKNGGPRHLLNAVMEGRKELRGLGELKEKALDSSLSNHLRRMLQVKMRTRYENGKMSGKINRRAVHRLLMPTVGDGQWNAKVFRSKTVPKDTLRTAVTLLVDYSGSMRYMKTDVTVQAVGSLTKALSACHVKHSVLTFTENNEAGNSPLLIGMVKDFDALAQPEVVMDRMGSLYAYQSENGDADAVAWAYSRLMRRKEPRKVLIVLSDGHPASQRPGSCGKALKNLLKKIDNESKVEVYALGIMSEAPRSYYRNNVICDDINQLEEKLIHLAGGLFDLYEEA